jgi:hypothetical protein
MPVNEEIPVDDSSVVCCYMESHVRAIFKRAQSGYGNEMLKSDLF